MSFPTITSSWEQNLLSLAQDSICLDDEPWQGITPVNNQALNQSILACEAIIAEHSRSFYRASSLLPKEKRRAIRVLYAFCRTADNMADGNVEQPEKKLLELRKAIAGQQSPSGDAVLTAWTYILTRYQIPLCYAEQLLDGVGQDLVKQRYSNFEELAMYAYGVASTVGLMSMSIIGFNSPQALGYAIKLGVALQITNILRDVGEDWNTGRLYLPLDELAAFSLGEADLAAGIVDERWRGFMRFQIARARSLYAEAMPGISLLHPDGRFSVAAASFLYRAILDDIEAHDYDIFNRRAFVRQPKKLVLLLQAFTYAAKRYLT